MPLHRIARPFVILTIPNDEFHFVMGKQRFDIGIKIATALAARRCLHIHDDLSARVACRDVTSARSLNHHDAACVEQRSLKLVDRLLEERLAPGDLHNGTLDGEHFLKHRGDLTPGPLSKGVFRIAP